MTTTIICLFAASAKRPCLMNSAAACNAEFLVAAGMAFSCCRDMATTLTLRATLCSVRGDANADSPGAVLGVLLYVLYLCSRKMTPGWRICNVRLYCTVQSEHPSCGSPNTVSNGSSPRWCAQLYATWGLDSTRDLGQRVSQTRLGHWLVRWFHNGDQDERPPRVLAKS